MKKTALAALKFLFYPFLWLLKQVLIWRYKRIKRKAAYYHVLAQAKQLKAKQINKTVINK